MRSLVLLVVVLFASLVALGGSRGPSEAARRSEACLEAYGRGGGMYSRPLYYRPVLYRYVRPVWWRGRVVWVRVYG